MINKFCNGLDEVFVIEEKRSFIEMLVKEEMYNHPNKPTIIGKFDEHNKHLIPGYGELTADSLIKILYKRYSEKLKIDSPNTKINILSDFVIL